MNKDIRYKQRFENLSKAFVKLKEAIDNYQNLSTLEKEGLIQRFEYTFELTWKTLKDYLESQGEIVKSPREVIKTAFKYEIIDDGDIWMDILEKRNLFAHTYDESLFNQSLSYIVDSYFLEIEKVYYYLESKK